MKSCASAQIFSWRLIANQPGSGGAGRRRRATAPLRRPATAPARHCAGPQPVRPARAHQGRPLAVCVFVLDVRFIACCHCSHLKARPPGWPTRAAKAARAPPAARHAHPAHLAAARHG